VPDEAIVDAGYSGRLTLSADTVLFDTVFTTIGSTTKRLRIKNPHDKAINISRIALGGASASPFTIYINGRASTDQNDLTLLGGDSLLILLEVLIDPRDEQLPFLVRDSIIIESAGNRQSVKLVAWGQDAHFIGNEILPCNTTWTATKPYVLYGSVLVDSLCQLRIEAGTKIYAAFRSTIFVKGSLIAEGTPEQRVLFRNDRFGGEYDNAPGQWPGIYFLEGSKGNSLNYTDIRNAEYGLRIGSPDPDQEADVLVQNTRIENMLRSGIIAFTSDVVVINTMLTNCGEYSFGALGGGNYGLYHCTLATYNQNIIRQTPTLAASDNIPRENDNDIVEVLNLEVINSIIDGSLANELVISLLSDTNATLYFGHNLVKTTFAGLDVNDNIINTNPGFVDPSQHNFRLDTLSPAIDAGAAIGVLSDLEGALRDEVPDIGAYEFIK
jgi:hypothetical protein